MEMVRQFRNLKIIALLLEKVKIIRGMRNFIIGFFKDKYIGSFAREKTSYECCKVANNNQSFWQVNIKQIKTGDNS